MASYSPKIKICGIRNPVDAKAIAEMGVDYIGMIFYHKSQRFVTEKEAAAVIQAVKEHNKSADKKVQTVGVFVNESPMEIQNKIERLGFDIVQLHGNEQPAQAAIFKSGIIRAIRVQKETDLDEIPYFQSVKKDALFLFDSYSSNTPGGTGFVFDHTFILNRQIFLKEHQVKFFMAGGLDLDNIRAALKFKPYGVDLNSGVEKSPGVKDLEKVRKAVERIRGLK